MFCISPEFKTLAINYDFRIGTLTIFNIKLDSSLYIIIKRNNREILCKDIPIFTTISLPLNLATRIHLLSNFSTASFIKSAVSARQTTSPSGPSHFANVVAGGCPSPRLETTLEKGLGIMGVYVILGFGITFRK